MTGRLFADKGYISKNLFAKLWRRGLQLVTNIRKNMQNKLIDSSQVTTKEAVHHRNHQRSPEKQRTD
ncbi:hypothetical protein IPL85_00600 [Candidatus Saccharibacteria bacterium]|nr:MAG: hypothetical protein IPL85_00600 [Candidatus Saccharibacteria bacterium]